MIQKNHEPHILEKVIPLEIIDNLNKHSLSIWSDVKEDYFSSNNTTEYRVITQKESHVSRVVSFRFATYKTLNTITNFFSPYLQDFFNSEEYFFCPYSYMRFCWPNIFISEKHKGALLYTEPHYDLLFNVEGISIWIPFEDITAETGGLCLFLDEDVRKRIPRAEKNHYRIVSYLDDAPNIDSFLETRFSVPPLKVGDAIFFGPHVLHGATKPISQRRISFNYRLIPRSELGKVSENVRKLILNFNKNIDLFNAINLVNLGDKKGGLKLVQETTMKGFDECYLEKFYSMIDSNTYDNSMNIQRKYHWSEEYNWI